MESRENTGKPDCQTSGKAEADHMGTVRQSTEQGNMAEKIMSPVKNP